MPPRAVLIRMAPGFILASFSALIRPAVASVSGAWMETMSLLASRSSSGIQLTLCSSRLVEVCSTWVPIERTICSTRLPMLPKPTSPTVQLPRSRTRSPRLGSLGQPVPARVALSSSGSRRSAASISMTVHSATDAALAPGMFATTMPRLAAASTSIVFTPVPSLWISLSLGAFSRSAPDTGRSTCHRTSASGNSR